MIKKIILLASLTISNLPFISNVSLSTNYSNDKKQIEEEACTVFYVGKNIAKDGVAIVARSADATPKGMNLNLKITPHNAYANSIVEGKNGFKWQMPSTTYWYTSTPRNRNVGKGNYWEASAINENGVGVSATLSCSGKEEVVGSEQKKGIDPLVPTGISEDNITQILGATSTSSRQAIEYLAEIIDKNGSSECNTILTIDQKETWYMEIYSGHQYIAIKMPDDKACTIGNEFMLDNVSDTKMFPNDSIIYSPNLVKLANGKNWSNWLDEEHNIRTLKLFESYARPLTNPNEMDNTTYEIFTDACHRRTWRGINMFTNDYEKYETNVKYPSFFVPNKKCNNNDDDAKTISVTDVIAFMRDRFDDILNNPNNPNYDTFSADQTNGTIRYVGVETAYQVHLLKSNPNVPKELACEEWLCLSNSNYAPFIPISNASLDAINEYMYVAPEYSNDLHCANCLYKRLNVIANLDRENYGQPITNLWIELENKWYKHYHQLLEQIKDLSLNVAQEAITNYTKSIERFALDTANELFDELTWHIANNANTKFTPLVSIEDYAKTYGWNYQFKDNVITLTNDKNESIYIDVNYKWNKNGYIWTNNQPKTEAIVQIKNNIPYISFDKANEFIKSDKIMSIDYHDYLTKNNKNKLSWWILVTSICIPIMIAIVITLVSIRHKKRKNLKNKQK